MLFMVLILIKILSNWFYFFSFPFAIRCNCCNHKRFFYINGGQRLIANAICIPSSCWLWMDWCGLVGPRAYLYTSIHTPERGTFPRETGSQYPPPPLCAYARTQTLTHVRRYILCTQSSPQQVRAFAKNNKKRLAGVNYIIIVNICVF